MLDVDPIDLASFDEYFVNSSRSSSLGLSRGLSSSSGSSAASASGWQAELTSPVWATAGPSSSAPPPPLLLPPCASVPVPPPEEPTANMSVEERLAHDMGPQSLPLGVALPLSSIYAALIVLGVLGNVLSLYIIVANRAMRTAANLFLCSLAVSDTLLLLCGAPEELLHAWYQYPWTLGEAYCAVKAVGLELGNDASVLTILLFSLARYFKICHSMWNIPLLESGSVRWTAARLTLIWGISLLFSLPFWPYMQVTHYLYRTEHILEERVHSNATATAELVECANASEWVARQTPIDESLVCVPSNEIFYEGSINHLMMVTSTLFFVVPMVLLVFIYSGIMCVIKKRRRELRSATRSDRRSLTSSSTNAAHTHLTQLHAANGATAVARDEPRRLSAQIFGIKPSSQLIALRILPPKSKKGRRPDASPTHKSPRRQLSQAPTSTAVRMQTLAGCGGSDRYGSMSRLHNENHVSAMSPACSHVRTPLSRSATALTHAASCSPRRTPQSSAPNSPDASKAAPQPDPFARRVSFMEEEKEAPGTASSQAAVGGTTHTTGNGSNNAHPDAHSSPRICANKCGAQNTRASDALRIPAACPERRANSVSLSAANSSTCLCPGGAQSPGVVRRATLDPIAPGAAAVLRRESTRSRSGSVDVGVSAAAYARRNRNRNSVGALLVSVVVAFFICYIPFHTQRILSTFNLLQLDPQGGLQYLFYISGLIYYMSAFVNPVVYSLASRRFRQELLRLVCQRRLRIEKLKWAAEGTSTHAAGGNCNSVRVVCAAAGGPTALQRNPSQHVAVAVHSPSSTPTRSPSVSPAHDIVALPHSDNTESRTGAETTKTTTTTTTSTTSKPSATESVPASNASPTAAARKSTLKAAAPSCFLIGTANPPAHRTERPSPLVAFESSTRRITERRSLNEYPESPPQIVNRRSLTSILEMPTHTGNSERSGSPPAPNWMCAPRQPNAFSVTQLIGANPDRAHQTSSADYSHLSGHTRTLEGESHFLRVTTQTVVFATSTPSND